MQKLKAAVKDTVSGKLKEPITLQHVLDGVRKQTGVVLHQSYLSVPKGRTADRLFDSVGKYELPVNIVFQRKDEAVLEVHVTARPSKAKGANKAESGAAAEEGSVAEEGAHAEEGGAAQGANEGRGVDD